MRILLQKQIFLIIAIVCIEHECAFISIGILRPLLRLSRPFLFDISRIQQFKNNNRAKCPNTLSWFCLWLWLMLNDCHAKFLIDSHKHNRNIFWIYFKPMNTLTDAAVTRLFELLWSGLMDWMWILKVNGEWQHKTKTKQSAHTTNMFSHL